MKNSKTEGEINYQLDFEKINKFDISQNKF